MKAEYRAYEVLNGTYRRVAALPEAVLQIFITCDVETAKIINLIAILLDSRLFLTSFMKYMMKRFDWERKKLQTGI